MASLSPGTVESGSSTSQSSARLEIVLGDEAREQPVVPKAAPESRRADHLGAAVHRLLHAEPALSSRALERLVPVGAGRVGRGRQRAEALDPLARPQAVVAREPAAREVLARHVERSPRRLAAAHRHDFGACRERIEPLRRRGEARADDRDRRRVVVRLVRMHGTRIVAQLVGNVEAGVAWSEQHMREPLAVQLEAAVDGPHPLDSTQDETLVPATPLTEPLDVGKELVHRRVIAVEHGVEQRPGRAASADARDGEPRERSREAVAVALGAHLLLPDRPGPNPPGGSGIGIRSEHRDLTWRERAAQRLVRGESRKPGTDDRNPRHHFTEPASSPWTK